MESIMPKEPVGDSKEPEFDQTMVRMAMEGFKSQQNLFGGSLAGLAAAVAGAAAWAAVTVATDYQIGWMAVGIGFLVGIAVRAVGKGLDQIFGVLGASLALLGCALGNLFTVVYFVAAEAQLGYLETLGRLDLGLVSELMAATFSPIDLLFYGIAVYEAYKFSFRQIGPDELKRAIKGTPGP